ncbi:MAG TPA: Ig-like domain-containing protein [Kofleriaceae bacterium]|nr:Ig-like domain-containing protein [Kofleriaceae bacterium]
MVATAAGLALTLPAAAIAQPATWVSGQGDSVLIDDAPAPLAVRPRRAMAWESIDPATATSQVNSHIIYLNRCTGEGCTIVQGNTNSTTSPPHSSLGHGLLSPFSRGDDTWNAVVACMKDVYAPFNVQITEDDPGTAPHFEIIFGGAPEQIGLSAGIGGVSPFSCLPYIPNSVVFVFDVWGNDPEELCATAAQEVAHSFALDHAIEPSDPMTYYPYTGRRHYMNAQIQCGSDCDADHRSPLGATCTGPDLQFHPCACGNGAQTQNSAQVIATLFGDGQLTAPAIKIVEPRVGDTVDGGFPVTIEVTNGVDLASTELRVDGALITTLASNPYELAGPATLADGTHVVEVTGYDAAGTPGRARVEVIVGPGCTSPGECPNATDTCIGGRCVPGPDADGGLGTLCVTTVDCVSWQCANDGGARYCVESCAPGQCPSGFGCRDDGQGGGVCWPGFDEGGGCSVAPGAVQIAGATGPVRATGDRHPLAPIALGVGVVALLARRRRRPAGARGA